MNDKFLSWIFLAVLATAILSSCGNRREMRKAEVPVKNEQLTQLQKKYAPVLEVGPEQIKNEQLYNFVDHWIGVGYRYGGTTKEGVDCSGFTCQLFESVYRKSMGRTTSDLFNSCVPIDRSNLEEGDLVFFDIETKKKSHVGVYLQNQRFVHASSSKGVIISDLNNSYYNKYFSSGGRTK